MTPTIVTIRAGVQFTHEAAAAFRRAEAQVQREFGRGIDVNSTYRDWDKQLSMFNAWQWFLRGGPYPGHSKALHPNDPLAFHTKGLALDSDDWTNARIVQILADNGFIRNRLYVPNEKHHFEYIRNRDKNYGKPTSGGNAAPATTPAVPEEEDEDMAMKGATYPKGGKNIFILFNEVSGFYVEHSGVQGDYNNSIAQKWGTGSWPTITEAHAIVIKRSLDAIRRTAVSGSLSVDVSDA